MAKLIRRERRFQERQLAKARKAHKTPTAGLVFAAAA
jgi:hypothetical protein